MKTADTAISGKQRESGIELFRIITMLMIVAHHYLMNTDLSVKLYESASLSWNSLFLLLFGSGGKLGINCFVVITGYFICTSRITLKKYLKLLLWVEFYKIAIFAIFLITGQQAISLKSLFSVLWSYTSVASSFTSAYLIFYLFIPFLNILIKGMDKKQHLTLCGLCIIVYSVFATIGIKVSFNYVTWFSVIYLIGSYIRLYPEKWFDSKKLWGWITVALIIGSFIAIIVLAYISQRYLGELKGFYHFVQDSNKILAVMIAISAFMYFKNIKIGYRKWINKIAASSFGVLLIHSNSDAMRKWLWYDLLDCGSYYNSEWLIVHAICSVIGIYIVCTLIDFLRIEIIEKPIFKLYDKKQVRGV